MILALKIFQKHAMNNMNSLTINSLMEYFKETCSDNVREKKDSMYRSCNQLNINNHEHSKTIIKHILRLIKSLHQKFNQIITMKLKRLIDREKER